MKINAFDTASIENAIKKLECYKNEIEKSLSNHIKELTKQQDFEFMISIVNVESGELKNSITWEFDETKQKGIIKVGAAHSIFVEYGTEIVGANSPHPELKEGYTYDVNNHGMKGWLYFDDKQNHLRWTRGQKASAFVYKTTEFLRNEADKEVVIKIG